MINYILCSNLHQLYIPLREEKKNDDTVWLGATRWENHIRAG